MAARQEKLNEIDQAEDVNGSDQFWRLSLIDVDYWKVYLDARPKYDTGDFYQRILKYHQSHWISPPPFPTVAHDVGTGPGQVAAFLAQHFDQVFASDLNKSHLKVAEHLLNTNEHKSKISLHHAGAEAVSKQFPPYSADFIAAAECMPLLNIPVAVSSWADLLRPGGTLAMWFYGRPAFAHDPSFDAEACNKLYGLISSRAFNPFYDVSGDRLVNVRKAMETMMSWFDNIELDPLLWSDVQRWKWNAHLPMEFSSAEGFDPPVHRTSKISEGEKVQEIENGDLWSEMWDFEDWKKFLKVNLPDFNGEWDEETQQMWRELETKMGRKGVKRKTIWPVVAVVASRKSEKSTSFWP